MARRSKTLRRRSSFRKPKARVVIVSEGRLTEPDYFYSLARRYGALITFDVIIEKGAGVPITIVQKAISHLQKLPVTSNFSEDDTVWAVFDKDEHPRFDEAINNASDAGVKVVFSNPCFELWLILHFEDWDRPIDRHGMQRELRKRFPKYDPSGSKRVDFSSLENGVPLALKRARKMEKRRLAERTPRGNPLTTVFSLVEHLLGATQAQKLHS